MARALRHRLPPRHDPGVRDLPADPVQSHSHKPGRAPTPLGGRVLPDIRDPVLHRRHVHRHHVHGPFQPHAPALFLEHGGLGPGRCRHPFLHVPASARLPRLPAHPFFSDRRLLQHRDPRSRGAALHDQVFQPGRGGDRAHRLTGGGHFLRGGQGLGIQVGELRPQLPRRQTRAPFVQPARGNARLRELPVSLRARAFGHGDHRPPRHPAPGFLGPVHRRRRADVRHGQAGGFRVGLPRVPAHGGPVQDSRPPRRPPGQPERRHQRPARAVQ